MRCNLVENIGNVSCRLLKRSVWMINIVSSFTKSSGRPECSFRVFSFFPRWTVGSICRHSVKTLQHLHHAHYPYIQESHYNKLSSCWEILLQLAARIFWSFQLVSSPWLFRPYMHNTCVPHLKSCILPRTPGAIQFLHRCCPTFENKNQ